MIYGYASTQVEQSYTKQKDHIKNLCEDVNMFCGNQDIWNKLLRKIIPGDTIIFDSVRILGHSPSECFDTYKMLLDKGINIRLCKESYLDSEIFFGQAYSDDNHQYALEIIERQINIAFAKNNNISAGLKKSKSKKSKQIGRVTGKKYETKKSKASKKIIEEEYINFGGKKTEEELIEEIGISRNTIKKYIAEIEYNRTHIDRFRGKYRFLSNFSDCVVTYNGITYPSTEAAYQAQKAATDEERLPFQYYDAETAKAKGGEIKLPDDWTNRSLQIMEDLLRLKFSQPEFKQLLLDTGDKILIEGTMNNSGKAWCDNFWGFCPCPKCKNEVKHNHLGRLLMQIRDELRDE